MRGLPFSRAEGTPCLAGIAFALAPARGEEPKPTPEKRIAELLLTLKTGTKVEQEKASHLLWETINYKGIGTLNPKDVVADLSAYATSQNDYVREYIIYALGSVRHESAVPTFIKALDDPHPKVRGNACGGLAMLGPKAKDAIPVLSAKIKDGTFLAFYALALIAEEESVPVILDAIKRHKLTPDQERSAAAALARFSDRRAIPFLAKLLDERGESNPPVDSATFFAKLGDAESLARLRKCLDYLPRDATGKLYQSAVNGSVAYVREIAVDALAKNKDKDAYEAILKMVEGDPSMRVRNAAADALGQYGDPRGVPVLVKAFGQKDEGFGWEGHPDGTLRETVAKALGKIGTDEALAALYAAAKDGPAKQQCIAFWTWTENPKHLDAFLKHFDTKPLEGYEAVAVITNQLHLLKVKPLEGKEHHATEADFLKTVNDPARFSEKANLTEMGKYVVLAKFSFQRADFATALFTFYLPDSERFVRQTSVLYRKTGKEWKPVGVIGVSEP